MGLLLLAVVLVRTMKLSLAVDPALLDAEGPARMVCGYLPQELSGRPISAQMHLQNGSGEITAEGRTIATIQIQKRSREHSFGIGWDLMFHFGNTTTIWANLSPRYTLRMDSDALGKKELLHILTALELE